MILATPGDLARYAPRLPHYVLPELADLILDYACEVPKSMLVLPHSVLSGKMFAEHERMGFHFYYSRDHVNAIYHYGRCRDYLPEHGIASLHANEALAYLAQAKFDVALALANQALAAKPTGQAVEVALAAKGSALIALGNDVDEGLKCLKMAARDGIMAENIRWCNDKINETINKTTKNATKGKKAPTKRKRC